MSLGEKPCRLGADISFCEMIDNLEFVAFCMMMNIFVVFFVLVFLAFCFSFLFISVSSSEMFLAP
jgi:hypothetical protein